MDSAPGGALDLQFEEEASFRRENLQGLEEGTSPQYAQLTAFSARIRIYVLFRI